MELQKAYSSNVLSNPPPNGTGGITSNYELKQGGKSRSKKSKKSRSKKSRKSRKSKKQRKSRK